jgi:hypothetical protein
MLIKECNETKMIAFGFFNGIFVRIYILLRMKKNRLWHSDFLN